MEQTKNGEKEKVEGGKNNFFTVCISVFGQPYTVCIRDFVNLNLI